MDKNDDRYFMTFIFIFVSEKAMVAVVVGLAVALVLCGIGIMFLACTRRKEQICENCKGKQYDYENMLDIFCCADVTIVLNWHGKWSCLLVTVWWKPCNFNLSLHLLKAVTPLNALWTFHDSRTMTMYLKKLLKFLNCMFFNGKIR